MKLYRSLIFTCTVISTLSLYNNKLLNNNLKTYCHSNSITSTTSSTTSTSTTSTTISTTSTTISTSIEAYRPNKDEYDRLDTLLLTNEYKNFTKNHALHESLKGNGKIEAYEIYKKKDSDEIKCIIKFGESLNGHPGIVHGGISALLIDNTFGWLFMSLKLPSAFTANLNINYRSPVYPNTIGILNAYMIKVEGRKMYMEAKMEDINGKELVNATTLFIAMK